MHTLHVSEIGCKVIKKNFNHQIFLPIFHALKHKNAKKPI